MDAKTGESMGCPVDRPSTVRSLLGRQNRDWWPDALAVDILAPNGRPIRWATTSAMPRRSRSSITMG
jgi:hypothetical protein